MNIEFKRVQIFRAILVYPNVNINDLSEITGQNWNTMISVLKEDGYKRIIKIYMNSGKLTILAEKEIEIDK